MKEKRKLRGKVDFLAGSLARYTIGKTNNLKKIRQQTQKIVAREIAQEGV